MINGRCEPGVELHPWRSTTVQEHRPDGRLCYRATLDEILSDDMMASVLRSARYEPNEFREMMTEMAGKRRNEMFVRLKLEETREGLVATISQRGDDGKITGRPSIFLVRGKEEAKQRAKAVARDLGLKTYGVVDKTSSRVPPSDRPATRNCI